MPAPAELALAVAMAAAAGLAGSIAVMRRMALASDALSHVALPGIGLAIMFHINPLVGGLAALLLGTILIWAIGQRTRIPMEAVTGVIFSAALAAGAMLTPGADLVDALFGSPAALGRGEIVFGLAAAAIVITFLMRARSRLMIRLVSPDLARTTGIDVARLDLLFLLSFALTVALGLRYLGALLMGSLIIIPAATAMQRARSLRTLQIAAVLLAAGATVAGALGAPLLHVASGPLTIVIAAAVFAASLAFWKT